MAESKKRKLDRVGFLGDYVMAFTNEIHTDVTVKPGILAHKSVLAVRSNVFKYMLDSDECKISVENSITIPDLTYEELRALLEFFYSGILSPANKHAQPLYLAAHKCDIPYLQDLCRDQFISSLNLSNVLDILELSRVPSDKILKEAAIRFVVMHMETIVNCDRYKSFVRKNPDLSLDITKDLLYYFNVHLLHK